MITSFYRALKSQLSDLMYDVLMSHISSHLMRIAGLAHLRYHNSDVKLQQ